MPKSIASIVLDHCNGVQPEPLPRKPRSAKVIHRPLTEDELQTKATMIECLKHGSWIVEFTKVDGSSATMECTLDSSLLPKTASTEIAPDTRVLAEHLIHVYAIDRKGWRSFVVTNVTKMYRSLEDL